MCNAIRIEQTITPNLVLINKEDQSSFVRKEMKTADFLAAASMSQPLPASTVGLEDGLSGDTQGLPCERTPEFRVQRSSFIVQCVPLLDISEAGVSKVTPTFHNQ